MEEPAIVLDHGGHRTKAGFSSSSLPSCSLEAVVDSEGHVGEDVLPGRSLARAVNRGKVEDWSALATSWNHIFEKRLKTDPEGQSMVLADSICAPRDQRGKLAEMVFENYNAGELFILLEDLMTLYSTGRTTGLVVDSGGTTTTAVPVFEGQPDRSAARAVALGGRDVTEQLAASLPDNVAERIAGDSVSSPQEAQMRCVKVCHGLKEKFGQVAADAHTLQRLCTGDADPVSFKLPDGTAMEVTDERYSSPEFLFTPGFQGHRGLDKPVVSFLDADDDDDDAGGGAAANAGGGPGDQAGEGKDGGGGFDDDAFGGGGGGGGGGGWRAHDSVCRMFYETARRIGDDITKDVLGNVVMSGGNTLMPGFAARFKKGAIQEGVPRVTLVATEGDPQTAVWRGGAALAELSTFRAFWVSSKAYEEMGPDAIERRFF